MRKNNDNCLAPGRPLLDRLARLPPRVGFRESRNPAVMFGAGDECFFFREFVLPDFDKSLFLICVVKKHPQSGFSGENYYYRIITCGPYGFPHGDDHDLHAICSVYPGHALDVMKDTVCACADMLGQIGLARKGSSSGYDLASEVFALEVTFPLLTRLYADLEKLNFRPWPVEREKPFVFREEATGQEVSVCLDARGHVALDTSKAASDFPRGWVARRFEDMWYMRSTIFSNPERPGNLSGHFRFLKRLKEHPRSFGLAEY